MNLWDKISKKFSKEFYIGLSIWIFTFFLPYIFLGKDCYIRVHDTLEGELIWLHLLSKSGHLYSISNDVILENLMNGLPRNVLPSGYTLLANLCHWFGIFKGYIVGQFIFKTIGYFSFYLFVKKYMHLKHLNEWAIVCVCLLLTSMQFFTPFGISVVGMPLLAYGFARLFYDEKLRLTCMIFFIFPFMSSFVWSGIEVIIIFGVLSLYLIYKKNRLLKKTIIGGFFFGLGTIFANIQFIYGMLFLENFRSHRVEYYPFNDVPNIWETISNFLSFFFSTHYHISIFVSTLIFGIFLVAYFGIKKNKWSKRLMYIIFFLVLWQALYPYIEYFTQPIVFIKSFRFNRFCFLLPFLWLVVFLISLDTIAMRKKLVKTIPMVIVCQFFILFFANDETAHNYKKMIGIDNFPSYNQYLAMNQFDEIKEIVPVTSRVASVGISPTIAQYHGYATLDGLFSVYSLDYKKEFRKIIKKELDKEKAIRSSFDIWGNRCYIFSAELGEVNVQNLQSKYNSKKIEDFEIDIEKMKEMGAEYIFSACEILNHKELNLSLIKAVGDAEYWRIYLYKL